MLGLNLGLGMSTISSRVELITNGDGSEGITGWGGDVDTTVSNVGGRIRGTLTGSNNPRLIQAVTGLTIGLSYTIKATAWRSAGATNLHIRVSDNPGLNTTLLSGYESVPSGTTADTSFVATDTTLYVGAVAVTATSGEYVEVDNVSLTKS